MNVRMIVVGFRVRILDPLENLPSHTSRLPPHF